MNKIEEEYIEEKKCVKCSDCGTKMELDKKHGVWDCPKCKAKIKKETDYELGYIL